VESKQGAAEKTASLSFFGRVGKAVDLTTAGLGFFGGALLFISGFLITLEVVMRYIFNAPTRWTDEISTLFVLTAAFTAISYGLREKSHVHMEFIVEKLPKTTQTFLESVSYLIVFLFTAGYSWFALKLTLDSVRLMEKSPMVNIIMWPVKAIIFISMVVLCLQALRMLLTNISGLVKKLSGKKERLAHPVITTVIFIAAVVGAVLFCLKGSMIGGVFAVLLVLLAGGVPIGFTLAICSAVGSIGLLGLQRGFESVPSLFYLTWNSSSIMALPLFVFLGYILHKTGLADDLFAFARVWVGRVPGGLAIATLFVCMVFAAVSGSSMANAVTVGLVAYPALTRYKYDEDMSAGMIAVGGTLGVLIPPSTAFLMIGIMTDESIGELFMSGIIPGVIATVLLSITAVIVCKATGKYEKLPPVPVKEKMKATKKSIGILVLPVLMLGGIYTGIFTANEAAAVSVVYALIYGFASRRIRLKNVFNMISDSTRTVGMIAILVAAGTALSNVMAMLRVPQITTDFIVNAGFPGWAVVLGTLVVVFLLDVFLDAGSITILAIPLFAPILLAYGYDMRWYAVIFVLWCEVGLITPPVGMNAFVVQQITGVSLMRILKGSLPFLIVLVLVMILVAAFPELATWLPNMMRQH
jgi:C4-dicarboxylate transporter DctM subunit